LYFRDKLSLPMPESKGHLNPGAAGVELERFEPDPALADLVRHVWLARWRLPFGEVTQQRVLTYPSFNLVVTDGSAALYGPEPKLQVRTLSGSGWALGLLLRPSAGRLLLAEVAPTALVGSSRPLSDAPINEVDEALSQLDKARLEYKIKDGFYGRAEGSGYLKDIEREYTHACRKAL